MSKVFFKNYDYTDDKTGPGIGFFSSMSKWKSVEDFLKHKKKRKREKIEHLAEEFYQLTNKIT